jgi:hypothetical protein
MPDSAGPTKESPSNARAPATPENPIAAARETPAGVVAKSS